MIDEMVLSVEKLGVKVNTLLEKQELIATKINDMFELIEEIIDKLNRAYLGDGYNELDEYKEYDYDVKYYPETNSTPPGTIQHHSHGIYDVVDNQIVFIPATKEEKEWTIK